MMAMAEKRGITGKKGGEGYTSMGLWVSVLDKGRLVALAVQ